MVDTDAGVNVIQEVPATCEIKLKLRCLEFGLSLFNWLNGEPIYGNWVGAGGGGD